MWAAWGVGATGQAGRGFPRLDQKNSNINDLYTKSGDRSVDKAGIDRCAPEGAGPGVIWSILVQPAFAATRWIILVPLLLRTIPAGRGKSCGQPGEVALQARQDKVCSASLGK